MADDPPAYAQFLGTEQVMCFFGCLQTKFCQTFTHLGQSKLTILKVASSSSITIILLFAPAEALLLAKTNCKLGQSFMKKVWKNPMKMAS
jgi:hypothetical protein